MQRQRRKQDFF